MRLALVTHNVTTGDGQGRVMRELALHAARAGAVVTLLADRVDADLEEQPGLEIEWLRVKPRMQSPNLVKVAEFARAATAILQRQRRWDVVHANGYVLNLPHQVNTAHFVHGAQPSVGGFGPGRAYRQLYQAANSRWEKRAFGQASRLVAVSSVVREELLAIGVGSERVTVIPNGVHPAPPCTLTRSALGLPSDRPVALFAGDLRTPRKNLDTVLKSLALLPQFHLAVAGAPEGSPFPALAEKLGVTDRVTWLGFRTDLPALYGIADIFLCPSRYEPFSLVLLEALAAGTPVVTSGRVGAAELADRRCTAVIPDPDDVNALAHAWRSLWEETRDNGEAVRDAAVATARRYSWARMGEAYMGLYQEMLR